MTNSYCQPVEADFWFPVAPGVTSLPANPLPITNPSPLPANAVTVPVGFDESNPDLCELFETILPSGIDPIYPVVVDPAQSVPPYQETVSYDLRIRSLITLQKFNYSLGVVKEIPIVLFLGFGQDVSYPVQPIISTRLKLEVLAELKEYQDALLGISLKTIAISSIIVTPKVLIHFNGDRTSQQVFDQMGYATVDPGSVRISDTQPKFNGSSGRIYAPFDKVKITYPSVAMTYEQAWSADFWFYIPGSTAKATYCLYSFNQNTTSRTGVYLYAYPGNSYHYIYSYVNESATSSYQTGNLLNAWNYCVLEKPANSYVIGIYINEIFRLDRSYSNATDLWNNGTVHSLGGDSYAFEDTSVNGWLSEFRVIDTTVINYGTPTARPTEQYDPGSNDWHIKITTSLKTIVEYVVLTIITDAVIATRLKLINYLDKFVQIVKYTGNGANGRVINTSGLAPHLISVKSNNYSASVFYDKSKGAGYLSYWTSYYNWQYDGSTIQAFGSDNYTIGSGSTSNTSGQVYYATIFGNTDIDYVDTSGAFSTTISANRDWGFSVIRYSGNGTSSSTVLKIPHGLSTSPAIMFAMIDAYYAEHTYMWGSVLGANKWIAQSHSSGNMTSNYNYISYDNTYINIYNVSSYLNAPYPITLYCFTSSPGRTKVGTYNGFDELSIYIETSFKPTQVMIRQISGTSNGVGWQTYDRTLGEAFDPFNTTPGGANATIVFGVNGFTVLAYSNQNLTGAKYMYYAIRGPLESALLSGEVLSLSSASPSTGLLKQSMMNSEALAIELGEQEADIFSYTYLLDGEPSSTVVTGEATGNTPAFTSGQTLSVQLGTTSADLLGGDIYQNNTSLLLHMNGANNSTTFTDNSPNSFTVTANGNAKISTAQSKFGGASGAFDGNGDNLSIADNAAFEFGAGDFTIEMWAYVTANKGYQALMNKSHAASDASGWILYAETDNTIYFRAGNSGSWSVALGSATIPTLNTWQHYAVTRSGTTWRLFIDGVQKASTTNSLSMTDGTLPLYIGRYPYFPSANSTQDFSGYIDEVRITKGIARYTAAFTPLNRPFFDALPAEDPSFSSVSLLMHMDGANASTSFADSSDSGLSLTANGNAQISTALSKFGGASALFDGTGDFLSRAYDAKFDFVLTDFTIEGWIRPTSWKAGGTRFVSTGGGTVAWNGTTGIHVLFQFDSTGKINLQLSNNTATPVSVVGTASAATNVWSHVAVSVSGSTAYLAVNGVVSSHALATRAKPTTTPQIAVATIPGEAGAVANAFVGNIDELRITKGVARYTANFTPPVGPFPSF